MLIELDGISGDGRFGVFCQDLVAPVVLEGQTQVKAFKCMEVPGVVDGGFVVDEDMASSWAPGHSIKVIRAKKGMLHR